MSTTRAPRTVFQIFGHMDQVSETGPALRANASESWFEFEASTGVLEIGQPTNAPAQNLSVAPGPSIATSMEEYVAWHKLGAALDQLRRIAAEVLGESTRVEYRIRSQDGDQQLVAEVRFPRGKAARERLTQFLERFVSELPVKAQQRITLLRLPA